MWKCETPGAPCRAVSRAHILIGCVFLWKTHKVNARWQHSFGLSRHSDMGCMYIRRCLCSQQLPSCRGEGLLPFGAGNTAARPEPCTLHPSFKPGGWWCLHAPARSMGHQGLEQELGGLLSPAIRGVGKERRAEQAEDPENCGEHSDVPGLARV